MFAWLVRTVLFFLLASLAPSQLGLLFADDTPIAGEPSDLKILMLKENDSGGPAFLYGELFLGDVWSGESSDLSFHVMNASARTIQLSIVRPSCACIDVKLPQATLQPNDRTSTTAKLTLVAPRALGKNVKIGSIQVFEDPTDAAPIAALSVFANVLRPFHLSTSSQSLYIENGKQFEEMLPLRVHENFMISNIRCSCESDAISIDVVVSDNGSPSIRVSGDGEQAIKLKSTTIQIEAELEGRTFSDLCTLRFERANAIRCIPAVVSTDSEKIRFRVYCRTGIDIDELKLLLDGKTTVEYQAKSILGSLIEISCILPGESKKSEFLDVVVGTESARVMILP